MAATTTRISSASAPSSTVASSTGTVSGCHSLSARWTSAGRPVWMVAAGVACFTADCCRWQRTQPRPGGAARPPRGASPCPGRRRHPGAHPPGAGRPCRTGPGALSEGPTPARKRLLHALVHKVQVQGRPCGPSAGSARQGPARDGYRNGPIGAADHGVSGDVLPRPANAPERSYRARMRGRDCTVKLIRARLAGMANAMGQMIAGAASQTARSMAASSRTRPAPPSAASLVRA